MPIAVPLRHELKFYISTMEYHLLSHALDQVLERDPNGDPEHNEYHIRSLYFDTYNNAALLDKLNGVKNRDKYTYGSTIFRIGSSVWNAKPKWAT